MNKPIPALDERGEFVEAKLRDGGTATVYAFANCQVHGNLRGTAAYWEDDGIFLLGMESDSDIINLPEIRATVERARRKREAEAKELNYDGSKWHEYTDCPKQTGCEYCLRARPTFAEALQAEASDAGNFRLMHMIERARRALEGL